MPGAYFTQGAVQNAVRERPTDEQLAFNKGRKLSSVSKENLDAIAEYIRSLGPEQEWTDGHTQFVIDSINNREPGWMKPGTMHENAPAWLAGGIANTIQSADMAIMTGRGAAKFALGKQAFKAGEKGVKAMAYKAAGKQGLKAAATGLRFAAEGATLPVALAGEVAAAGIGEAGNVMSRPSVEQVQGNVPEALFHGSRDPNDLTKWKDWSHVGGKMLHALNPFEGAYRLNQMADAINNDPNAQVDFDSANEYLLSGGLPKGFGPSSNAGSELYDRMPPLRAERVAYIDKAGTPQGAREYAIHNAILNQRFLAAKKAADEKARLEGLEAMAGGHMFF
jgi:hypothetical protein